MYTVYILYSQKHNKVYIGYSSDLSNRIISHSELATHGYTLRYRPWVIAYTEEYPTKAEAIKRENQLKSARGRIFVREIINKKFNGSDG